MMEPERYPPATRGLVVLWGLLATAPYGGMTWQVLQHLVGLRRLGFDVWYVEESITPMLRPSDWWPVEEDLTENRDYLARHMDRVGLADRWVLHRPGPGGFCTGALDEPGLERLYRDADAVLNLCGANKLRPEHESIARLVLLQTDPVAQQIRVAESDPWVIAELDAYDLTFTYATNIGQPDCGVPCDRYEWIPTVPPILLDWWATTEPPDENKGFTTVGNWRNQGKDVEWRGDTYRWQKALEFEQLIGMPARCATPLELALVGNEAAESARLREHGWRVVSARDLAEPMVYREYIQSSAGEFTVAKDQNIRLQSGWFSDRSACYLAAGRPVVAQDTGFAPHIPVGQGLFAFCTEDDAVQALDTIVSNYDRHSRDARAIAEEYFAASKILGAVMDRIADS